MGWSTRLSSRDLLLLRRRYKDRVIPTVAVAGLLCPFIHLFQFRSIPSLYFHHPIYSIHLYQSSQFDVLQRPEDDLRASLAGGVCSCPQQFFVFQLLYSPYYSTYLLLVRLCKVFSGYIAPGYITRIFWIYSQNFLAK